MKWFSKYLNTDAFVQYGHGVGGYALLISPLVVEAVRRHVPICKPLFIGIALVIGWTVPKEFIFDTLVEKATVAEGVKDARSYAIGAGVALLFIAALALLFFLIHRH